MKSSERIELRKHYIDVVCGVHQYRAAYLDVGQGQPLVFLHGFMGEGRNWRSLLPYLDGNHRCICLDMLGFGESSKPKIRYDIATLVEFVHHTLDAIGLNPHAIVGHSLGGWVASAYALTYPEVVKGLLLLAPAGIRDDSFCGRYDHLRPLLWETPVVDWLLNLAGPVVRLQGHGAALAQIRWMRRELNNQPAPRSFLLDRLRPEDAIDTVEKDIHALRVPTLVITGDRDDTIPMWHCETYTTEILGAELVVIPGAVHSLPQDHAADIAPIMLPFLNALW